MAGRTTPPLGKYMTWVLKLAEDGSITWQKLFIALGDCGITSVQQTDDRGYVLSGWTGAYDLFNPTCDGWLIKLDSSGGIEWQKEYGGANFSYDDTISAVQQAPDGGFIAAGMTESLAASETDLWVLKLDANGEIQDCPAVQPGFAGSEDTSRDPIPSAATVMDGTAEALDAPGTAKDTEALTGDGCTRAIANLVDIARTGQTTPYHPGDDGTLQAGAVWPSPRFTDNGDGTITDNLTGLVWLKDANYANTIGHDPDGDGAGRMSWTSALDFVADINAGDFPNFGYTDWRLANVNEMDSLVNAEQENHAVWLIGQGFSHVQDGIYWSSTTYASSTNSAWELNLGYGGIVAKLQKRGAGYVWPVRQGQWFHPDPAYPANVAKTGQTSSLYAGDDGALQAGVAWPSPRFTDHGDGTVMDNLTGLMWLKDAGCFVGLNWQNALDNIDDLNSNPSDYQGVCHAYSEDYPDWRMPNRKELAGLFDRSRSAPALPEGHPFENIPNYYTWSSSTVNRGTTNRAWAFATQTGAMLQFAKVNSSSVWPVRGGIHGSPIRDADFDGDGDVDGSDLAMLAAAFGSQTGDANFDERMDLVPDGIIDEADLQAFAQHLGRTV